MQCFLTEGKNAEILVSFAKGKVGKDFIHLLRMSFIMMKHSQFHTYCETTSYRERACNLQLDELGCSSSFALTSSVILE